MAIQLAEAELVGSRPVRKPEARPNVGIEYQSTTYRAPTETGGPAGRGIMIALLISAPFWALIAFTVYLLS